MPEKLCRTSLSPAKIALGCGMIPRFHGCARLSMAGFQGVEFGSRLDICDKTTRNVWPIIDYVIVGSPDDGFLAPPGHLGTKRRLTRERTSSSGLFRSFFPGEIDPSAAQVHFKPNIRKTSRGPCGMMQYKRCNFREL